MPTGGANGAGGDESATTRGQSVYLFNVLVGTGLFGLPRLFALAGGTLASFFLALVAFLSLICATWLVESLAITAVLADAKDSSSYSSRSLSATVGSKPLWSIKPPKPWVTQSGMMSFMLLSRAGQIMWFTTLVCYLYGDLAVYAVFVPDTLMRVFPTIEIGGKVLAQCDTVYFVALSVFTVAMVPFVFFPLKKTRVLQIITGVQRHLVFWTIILWAAALIKSANREPTPAERGANFKSGPALLFGNAVYGFICQQYIPSIVSPVRDKTATTKMVGLTLLAVLCYYLALCWMTLYAFPDKLELISNDIVTFAFQDIQPRWLAKLVMAVPLLGVCTNYPIIAIVLRDNLIILWRLAQDAWTKRQRKGDERKALLEQDLGDGAAPGAGGFIESREAGNYAGAVRGRLNGPAVQPLSTVVGPSFADSSAYDLSYGTTATTASDVPADLLSGEVEASQCMKVVVGLLAAMPSMLLAATHANVGAVIAICGSYGGCMIMFVFPAIFVWAARKQLNNPNLPAADENPFRSPFTNFGWIVGVLIWAAAAISVSTAHFIANGFGGDDSPECIPIPQP